MKGVAVARHIYLVKDNDDLVSYCGCPEALITFPPQLDCPWCGCGWLFTCITCQVAFTFARGEYVNESWEATARRDLANRFQKEPSTQEMERWIQTMQALLGPVQVGSQYVYFDGAVIATDCSNVKFKGWHAQHDLDFVPQIAALYDSSVEEKILCNLDYWQANAIEPRQE